MNSIKLISFCLCIVCGRNLTALNGTFTSPYYPRRYDSNLDCIWRIRVPSNYKIRLSFNYFQTERADCVSVYDGKSVYGTSLGRFCGDHYSLPFSVTSNANYMTVRFFTDGSGTYGGFFSSYFSIYSDIGELISFQSEVYKV